MFGIVSSIGVDEFPRIESGRHLLADGDDKSTGTRSTWRGVKISNRICGMDENGDCHIMEYAEALSKYAAPGIILAILSIISLPVFCIGRFCCNCFGGRRRSKGICCGKRDQFEGYSLKEIWIIKLLLIAAMVGIALCVILGYVGDKSVSTGITKSTTTLISAGNTIVDKASIIAYNLSSLPYTKDEGAQIGEFVDTAKTFLDQAESIEVVIKEYNKYRSIAVIISFALPLGLLVIGVVGAIFNFRYLALIAFFFCFLVSIIIWISFSVHSVVHTVFIDVCYELDVVMTDPPPPQNNSTSGNNTNTDDGGNGGIQDMIKDIYYCTQFSNVGDLARGALDDSYKTACDGLTKLCNDSYVNCSDSYNGGNCSRENLQNFLGEHIRDYVIGCNDTYPIEQCPANDINSCMNPYLCVDQMRTVKDCATNCINEELRGYANTTVFGLEMLFLYTDIIENEVLPLLNCTIVQNTFSDVSDAMCVNIKQGVSRISVASGFLGALLIPGTILLLLGFKRFRKNRFPIGTGLEEGDDKNVDLPVHNTGQQHQSQNEHS